MLHCLIVDDDPVVCKLLESYCRDCTSILSAKTVNEGSQALRSIAQEHFDLIFLDLNLPDTTGQELLEVLPKDLPVIMVTSEPGFAVDSYNFNVVGYLLKPITLVAFTRAVNRVSPRVGRDHIFVKDGNTQVKVVFANLKYIKSESNYVTFYCKDRKVMSLMKMADLEDKLLPDGFIRIHRSYIVNRNFIEKIGSSFVMIEDIELPLSDSYKQKLASALDL